MKNKIPVFPLKIVVFPGSKYPLHIFEERYKKLINKCIADNDGFGIVALTGDDLPEIGVYVKVEGVIKKYDSGEMDIIVKGLERFARKSFSVHPDGYNEADVDSYSDDIDEWDNSLFQDLKIRVKRLYDQIRYNLRKSFWENLEKTSQKSFKIAEKSGLTLQQQQELLTYKNEDNRLEFLINHFITLEEKLGENIAKKEIIIGDGYLN